MVGPPGAGSRDRYFLRFTLSNTPSSAEDFTDQFFNELNIVLGELDIALSVLDIAVESVDVRPEVTRLVLAARAHAQAMVAPARWLLRQYEDSVKREKTLECALNMALDIGREKNTLNMKWWDRQKRELHHDL